MSNRSRSLITLFFLLLIPGVLGCQSEKPGSEQSAREFVDAEFTKWMSGGDSKVRVSPYSPPINYQVQSVVPDTPSYFAHDDMVNRYRDGDDWPAFTFNVTVTFKSEAGTSMDQVKRYNLTWNVKEKKWFVWEKL